MSETMAEFDVVLIGSGPAAVAAIDGIHGTIRVAAITGAAPASIPPALLHAKVRAVATESRQPAGVAEPAGMAGQPKYTLFSTAAVGGLANYWGQQFVRQAAGDPWPRDIFASYDDYTRECGAVEQLFTLRGGEAIEDIFPKQSAFRSVVPTLLAGSVAQPQAGLAAMALVFQMLAQREGAAIFNARAISFAKVANGWRVALSDGGLIVARRIILAAGVVGNAHLILRSYSDLISARFRDHTPWMAYMIGLRSVIAARPRGALRHFNAISLIREEAEKCTIFASVYDMRQAELNLLLASTLGRTSPILRGWPAPPGAGLVQPMQVWTVRTEGSVELDARRGEVSLPHFAEIDHASDLALTDVTAAVSAIGGRVLKVTMTKPGFGFHYHALEVRPGDGGFTGAAEFLRDRTENDVVCVDASILREIGCRPPTLTAMAAARRLAS